jgi:lipoate-protein ligase A
VFNSRKFGGNAQSISKDKWLHHTSFLWDFDPRNMEYLTNPERQPAYREKRSHTEFLCTLKDVLTVETRTDLATEFRLELDEHFEVEEVTVESIASIVDSDHRRSTRFLDL